MHTYKAADQTKQNKNPMDEKILPLVSGENENSVLLKVNCTAMKDAGIAEGDIVIVEKDRIPVNGNIVVAALNEQLVLRQIEIGKGKISLIPASSLSPIHLDGLAENYVWGVVTFVIKKKY